MGAQNSNLRRCIDDEFQRLRKDKRDFLVLDEILQLRLPQSSWAVDTNHLGVLFLLDSNHDGRFTLDELLAMVDMARGRSRKYQPHEFPSQMQGWCSLQLWRLVSSTGGKKAFIQWVKNLLVENQATATFKQYSGHVYINRYTIETLHQVLNVQETQGKDFQTFFEMLQRVGEEMGLMDLAHEELDDWLPVDVIEEFLGHLNVGMSKVMAEIWPSHELDAAV